MMPTFFGLARRGVCVFGTIAWLRSCLVLDINTMKVPRRPDNQGWAGAMRGMAACGRGREKPGRQPRRLTLVPYYGTSKLCQRESASL